MRLGVAAAVACVALAACGADETILEVDGSAVAADRVELVIAGDPCATSGCTVTGPSGNATMPVFLRDGHRAQAQATTDAGVARFQLEKAPGGASTIGKLVAVGWQGNTAVGFATVNALPLDKPGIFQVALKASSQARAFAVWTNDMQAPTTAQYACVTAADGSASVTIVPAEDPDCDGFTGTQECPGGDHIYHNKQPVPLADMPQANCAVDVSVGGANSGIGCRLGGTGCTDGMTDIAPDAACQASKFCVPEVVCNACSQLDLACLRAHVIADPQAPAGDLSLRCGISLDTNATPCASSTDNPILHVPISPMFRTATCSRVTFAALGDVPDANDFHFQDGSRVDADRRRQRHVGRQAQPRGLERLRRRLQDRHHAVRGGRRPARPARARATR